MESSNDSRDVDEPARKKSKVWSLSKDAQQLIINCHKNRSNEKEYGSVSRTSALLNVDRKQFLYM